jgi:tetratricopeptide (TPR) repeat protein
MEMGDKNSKASDIIKLVQDVWSVFRAVVINVTGAMIFFAILAIIYGEVISPTISILSISVPKELSERGYTEQAAALDLKESLTKVVKLSRTKKDIASINLGSTEPSVIVPETGVSLDFIADRVRRALRIGSRWKITGALVVVDQHYVFYFSADNGIVFHTAEVTADDMHTTTLFTMVAQNIFEIADPYVLAASLYDTDRDKALELVDNIIETYPAGSSDLEYAHVLRGTIFLTGHKIDQAILEFENVIALDPKNSTAHLNICAALVAQGAGLVAPFKKDNAKLDKAMHECQTAIDLDPKIVAAYTNQASALNSEGQPEKALEKYQEAVARNPKDANAHAYLGYALSERNQLDQAVVELQTAIALDPHRASFHQTLANVLQKQHKDDEAKAEIEKADKLSKQ